MKSNNWGGEFNSDRPRGLLLDFGSVITVSMFEQHSISEKHLGLAAGTLKWKGPIDPANDPLWVSMQNDEITERRYWEIRAEEIGELAGAVEPWSVLECLTELRNNDPNVAVRPEAIALIRAAKTAGLRVGILTNELELFYGRKTMEKIEVLREIDCIVDATHTKILKPDPRSYLLAVEAMGLPANAILFVDDQFRNIEGGHRCGMQTQFFDLRDPAGAYFAITARLRLPIGESYSTQQKEACHEIQQ